MVDHDMISMFTFLFSTSGVSFDSSSINAGRKVPGPCTSGRSAAISEAIVTAEILVTPKGSIGVTGRKDQFYPPCDRCYKHITVCEWVRRRLLRFGLSGHTQRSTERSYRGANHTAGPGYLSKKRVSVLQADNMFTVGDPIHGPSHADDAT